MADSFPWHKFVCWDAHDAQDTLQLREDRKRRFDLAAPLLKRRAPLIRDAVDFDGNPVRESAQDVLSLIERYTLAAPPPQPPDPGGLRWVDLSCRFAIRQKCPTVWLHQTWKPWWYAERQCNVQYRYDSDDVYPSRFRECKFCSGLLPSGEYTKECVTVTRCMWAIADQYEAKS